MYFLQKYRMEYDRGIEEMICEHCQKEIENDDFEVWDSHHPAGDSEFVVCFDCIRTHFQPVKEERIRDETSRLSDESL